MSETLSTASASPRRFTIRYDDPASRSRNRWLQGAGELSISGDGRTFRFSGRIRKAFSRRERVIVLPSDQIANAVNAGRAIVFTTGGVSPDKPRAHFVFFCETEADAVTVKALLPAGTDDAFAGEQSFHEKLADLPAATHWARSVTGVLILANCAVFVIAAALFKTGWLETESMDFYVNFGANQGAATTGGEWWRLVTSMFLHFGLIHLAFNMWALFNLGQLMEKLAGRPLYAVLYFASGLGSGLASIWWNGDKVWSAGASGAIFGIMGATLGYLLRQRGVIPPTIFKPMLKSALLFTGYNLIFGLSVPGIDNAAHLGGFATGFVVSWLTALPLELDERRALYGRRLALGIAASVIIVATGVAVTPRFDYRVAEELRWQETVAPFKQDEGVLSRDYDEALATFLKTRENEQAFTAFLEERYQPLYRKLGAALRELKLTPGLATDRRRTALLSFVDARLDVCEHLLKFIRQSDGSEFARYEAAKARAVHALQELSK